MRALWQIFRAIFREQRVSMARGVALAITVVAMGVALLGLSGWFITAAAGAGLLGIGATFDVFRPSAMVRFLALGRSAARYGERVLTHDATLRALESLRARVLSGLMAAPYARLLRIRGAQSLSRLTSDIDALDGVPLRLVLPAISGFLVQIAAFGAVWALVDLRIALWIALGYVAGAAVIIVRHARPMAVLSRRSEAAGQAFRARLIDLIRARRDLAAFGRIEAQTAHIQSAFARRITLRRAQDRAERRAGVWASMTGTIIAGGALGLGLTFVQRGELSGPMAALGFFTALALAETLAPLRRGIADYGRMAEAARRVARDLAPAQTRAPNQKGVGPDLQCQNVTLTTLQSTRAVLQDFSMHVAGGEMVAIMGPSGVGKSTLLAACAGVHPVARGQITLGGVPVELWGEAPLRAHLAMLPQRSALMAGSVADALRLATPECSEPEMWQVLEIVQLSATLRVRQGLETQIGARGDGVSGGEARRLTLARVLLKRPQVLLLDEPTEGLDLDMADLVLRGVRAYLPDAAIVIASHRPADAALADRTITLT